MFRLARDAGKIPPRPLESVLRAPRGVLAGGSCVDVKYDVFLPDFTPLRLFEIASAQGRGPEHSTGAHDLKPP